MSRIRNSEARIDLDALRGNYHEIRRAAERDVIAVVKADAYGHGAGLVSGVLAEAGCARFAVASLEEAVALREAGIVPEILVLSGVHDAAGADEAVARRLTSVVHHRGHVELLAGAVRAAGARPVPVHVEVDTGMRRMGVPEGEAAALLGQVAEDAALRLEGVFTHPARADEADLAPTRDQLKRFAAVLEAARERGVEPGLVHWANSAAALAPGLAGEAPGAGAVRPGLALYGAQPSPVRRAALQPVMTLATRVVHVRAVEPGDAVGYGGTWRAERPTRIATLAAGYADGVPRAAAGRARAAIGGRSFPLVGRVSMDYVTADVGDTAPEIGEEAILFGAGEESPPVEELADAAGTLAYEIFTGVGPRVPRIARSAAE